MKKKAGKLIAPVIICVLVVAYLGWWTFAAVKYLPLALWQKLVGALVPLAIAAAMVYVLVERIKEIRSGEEDDLGKY